MTPNIEKGLNNPEKKDTLSQKIIQEMADLIHQKNELERLGEDTKEIDKKYESLQKELKTLFGIIKEATTSSSPN